ncbi:nectin-1-like [Panthera tigris]|uniref:nectin-1-like n=1 Tax=Panthera tigris TaxID=9694 RepID=UPI001C6FAEB6|nr:nectin-1-like [Panthera tigris]
MSPTNLPTGTPEPNILEQTNFTKKGKDSADKSILKRALWHPSYPVIFTPAKLRPHGSRQRRCTAGVGSSKLSCHTTQQPSYSRTLGGGGAFCRPPNASPLPGSPSSLSAQLHAPEESDRGWHQGAFCSVPQQGKGNEHKPDSPHRIKYKNNETAVFGENVTIFCNLTTPADVVQITWQKIQGSLRQNIGTYSNIYGEKILPPYRDRLHCEVIEPNSSFITIREVTFEDEACYKCLFNVFPQGSHSGQICLNIIAVSEIKTELQSNFDSEDFLSFTYSAVGKPVPQISLFPSKVLINPPEEYLAQNPNGTVTITKMYNVSLETVRSLSLQHLIVHMDHPLRNEEKIVPLSVKQE